MIYIVRHAIRQDRKDKDWPNRTDRPHDTPLSKEGFLQAIFLGKRLAKEPIEHVFCSPFMRAVQTAHLVAQEIGIQVKIEHGLAEFLRKSWFPLNATDPTYVAPKDFIGHYHTVDTSYEPFWKLEFPESRTQVTNRTKDTTAHLIEKYGENLLLVGHGISVKRCAQSLVGYDVRIGTSCAGLTAVERDGDGWKLILNNDRTHLKKVEEVLASL